MSNDKSRITIYDNSMAEAAAVMFNEFNKLWPGGFGGGIPYTTQRVREWLDKTSAIADLIAINDEDELCGYCGLYPHWRDKDAAYISILGVTPKAQGKKFGKRMLLKSLELAKEKGITRVDLGTWSGNLEAVPLYKKVGLFWVPETSVYMQDFIPGILQAEIAQEWFEKHPDWYGNFVRDLHQVPDKQQVDNMDVYIYRFEADNDLFIAEIDRFGWGICGFERVLDGKKLIVNTRIKSHEIFTGLTNTFTINIYNEYDDEIEVKLDVKPFKGLMWKEDFPKSITVKKGKAVTLSRDFVTDKTTKLYKNTEESCDVIQTKVSLGKMIINLSTSGKIQSSIKLSSITENRFNIIPIGKKVTIPLDIANSTSASIEGYVKITADGLPDYLEKKPFTIAAKEISGFSFPVEIPVDRESNKFMFKVTPVCKFNGAEIEMPDYKVPIFAKTNDLLEIAELQDDKRLYLVTDKLSLRVSLEGGDIRITHLENSGSLPLTHQAGPPYGYSLDTTLKYDYELKEEGKYHLLILRAKSLKVQGLLIEKIIKVAPGMNELEYWVKHTNYEKDKAITVSARIGTASGGISLSPYAAKGRAFSPIKGKIIETLCSRNLLSDPMIPSDPEIWDETWNAVEGLLMKDYSAYIWKPDNIEKVKLRNGRLNLLESTIEEISPSESTKPIHLWYSFGYNNIQEIRNRWNQLVGNQVFPKLEEMIGPKIVKALDLKMTDEKIFFAGETVTKKLTLSFTSAYPLPGTLKLNLPKGWKGSFVTKDGKQPTIPMPEPQPFTDIPLEIEITVPEKVKAVIENIQVHFSGEFELDFDNQVIVTTKGEVKISEQILEGKKIFEVANGNLEFKVAAEIGGNLIRLKDRKGRSFVLDSYPEIKPKFFLENYLGGMQIQTFHQNAGDPFSELEDTKAEAITVGPWFGVKTSWTIIKDKYHLFGLNVETKYLTLPNSDIIRVIVTLDNNTPRTIPWFGAMLSDIGLNGSKEGNVLEVHDITGTWFRNSMKKQFLSQGSFDKPYSRVSKGNQSLAFVIPEGHYGSTILFDLGVMLLEWLLGVQYAEPNSKSTIEFAIMINQSQEKMTELVQALAKD
ncbi:MAG: GNAT family N-acetyltransferase [Candidatus Heimdallarchaeota archaeon]